MAGCTRSTPTSPSWMFVCDEGNGIEACREIRSLHPRTGASSSRRSADDEALFQAIMAGAAGYVLKQIRSADLVDAVRRVAAGQSLLDPVSTARVLERFRQGPSRTSGSPGSPTRNGRCSSCWPRG